MRSHKPNRARPGSSPASAAPGAQSAGPAVWRLYALLAAVVFVAYINSFALGVALDGHLPLGDARVHAATWENLKLIFNRNYWWPSPFDGLYRPLTTLSFLLNYSILGSGANAAGYHAVNFLLHLANACLVFTLARRLFDRPWTAFLAAALWAVHPVGSDTVANLGGRADLLAALGILGSLVLYERIARRPQSSPAACAGLFGMALLAAFSKELGAVLLGLMLLADLASREPRAALARRLPAYAAAALASAVYWMVRVRVFQSLPAPVLPLLDNPLLGAGFWEARWTAIKVVGMDLWLLLWPARLASDRSFHQIPISGPADPAAWVALLVIAAILGYVIPRRSKEPLLFWCAGFFGIALLPVSNLVVLIGATMAERFLYLPAIGFAVAAAALVDRFAPRQARAILAAAIALCAVRTLVRNPNWNDDLTLVAHDVQVAPASFRAHEMRGEFLYAGNPAAIDESLREVETAWRILSPLPASGSYAQVPATLGMLYGAKGDAMAGSAGAAAWYARSLDVLEQADRISRAVEDHFDAVQRAHGKPLATRVAILRVYHLLGITYSKFGRNEEAVRAFHYARGIDPTAVPEYDAAITIYTTMGRLDLAALEELEKDLVLGIDGPALARLADAYAKVPGGGCAVDRRAGLRFLNAGCPRLQADLCRAVADVRGTFLAARRPDRAAAFGDARLREYGCAADTR